MTCTNVHYITMYITIYIYYITIYLGTGHVFGSNLPTIASSQSTWTSEPAASSAGILPAAFVSRWTLGEHGRRVVPQGPRAGGDEPALGSAAALGRSALLGGLGVVELGEGRTRDAQRRGEACGALGGRYGLPGTQGDIVFLECVDGSQRGKFTDVVSNNELTIIHYTMYSIHSVALFSWTQAVSKVQSCNRDFEDLAR